MLAVEGQDSGAYVQELGFKKFVSGGIQSAQVLNRLGVGEHVGQRKNSEA